MPEPLRIPADDLERAFGLLMEHLRARHGDVIALDVDDFWSIPPDARYDVAAEPTKLTVGQISESWEWIRQLLERDGEDALAFHLVWLAEILRAIGETASE